MQKTYPSLRPTIDHRAIIRCLDRLVLGSTDRSAFQRFTRDVARYLGLKHALFVPAARWGLVWILEALGLVPGDEIILSSFTFPAVPAMLERAGFVPVFADLAPGTLTMDPDKVINCLSKRTRALIATHLAGIPFGLDRLQTIARTRGIPLIEDCAQAFGADYAGIKVGSLGSAGIFSLSITKSLSTITGGLVVTDDDLIAEAISRQCKELDIAKSRNTIGLLLKATLLNMATSPSCYPLVHRLLHLSSSLGLDLLDLIFREGKESLAGTRGCTQPSPVFAELGIEQLRKFHEKLEHRRKLGRLLREKITSFAENILPRVDTKARSSYASFPLFVGDKIHFRRRLLSYGVDSSAGFVKDCSAGIPSVPSIQSIAANTCPNAASVARRVIYVPLYDQLSEDDVDILAHAIRRAYQSKETGS